MHWYEVLGYVGSVLMFSTFYMKTMGPLRVVAILANVCMIGYTLAARNPQLYPVLILQCCLLPLNAYRLFQLRRLLARMAESVSSDFNLDALIPFMTRERKTKGTVLFRKGDRSDKLYLIQRGAVRLEELNKVMRAGELMGEIGILAANNQRTASAVCEEDTELLSVTEDRVLQLYFQDPRFGLFLVRLVIQRLLRNQEARPTAA